ncbi:MAG TPA: hypothetical protein VKC53_00530 [Patescibacteria group bacterium]|nr:hypothetical protein [Patescibacteria group bacterium]
MITNPALGNIGKQSGVEFFKNFIPGLIGLGFVAGTIIFFFILIIGAIQWITAGGDKGALEGARGKISSAIVGIIILFSLFAVLDLIHIFFNIKIMTLDIGPLVIR